MLRYFDHIYITSMICVMKIIDPQCIWIENQYWSIGPDIIVPDVSDHIACCKLCKEDPECNSFSWGYPSHAYANDCYKKKNAQQNNAQGRSEFISSPVDISGCSCEGTFRKYLDIVHKEFLTFDFYWAW